MTIDEELQELQNALWGLPNDNGWFRHVDKEDILLLIEYQCDTLDDLKKVLVFGFKEGLI